MKRALLVIDVQNEYFTGRLPITHPADHFGNILRAVDGARGKMPVVFVQHHMPQPGLPLFERGSREWELHPEIARRPHDLLVEKTLPGSFTNTDLEKWLRDRGVDTVAVVGYMTHMCCDTTAREAVHRGFAVEFLGDATGTLAVSNSAGSVTAEEMQRSILCAQQMLLSEVVDTTNWLGRL